MRSAGCISCFSLYAVLVPGVTPLGGSEPAVGSMAPAGPAGPVVREERTVHLDGHAELWRLEWRERPAPVCFPPDPGWFTCPCIGFEYGESGELDLVRLREGREIERLPLTPLFEDQVDGKTGAILRRHETRDGDLDDVEDPDLEARVRARPLARIMELADYDRDGQATEFLLQVAADPCGKRLHVAVGVSRGDPHLHVFRSLAHPERPLILRLDHWQALRDHAGPVRQVDWQCGDHAADTETELELRAGPHGISVREREYDCTPDDKRGKLLGETDR